MTGQRGASRLVEPESASQFLQSWRLMSLDYLDHTRACESENSLIRRG